jgi:hypothetical protein
MRHLLFSLLLLSTACIAEEPGVSGGEAVGPDAGVADASPDDEEQGVPLQVEGVPPQTYWDTVPVYGRGPANGTVRVDANVDTLSVELGPDGYFCLDIPLEKGAVNVLDLVAIDELGERSDAQSFDVAQAGEPPEPGEPVAARNMALGGLPADDTLQEQVGFFSAMTDGNLSTSVVLQNAVFYSDWLILRIPAPEGIEKIRVYSNPECLAGDYLVHTAPAVLQDMAMPGALPVDEGPWTFRGQYEAEGERVNVTNCSDGSLDCQEYNFDSTVTGAIGINFTGDSCSNAFSLGEHQIHEIQAWSPEGVAPPTITAPSCQGGF